MKSKKIIFGQNPPSTKEWDEARAETMYNDFMRGYLELSKEEKAIERLSDGILYQRYCKAQKYGMHLYNHMTNGGRYQPNESGA